MSTTTISNLGGYDTYFIYLYYTVTTANNTTYDITFNNTTNYAGVGLRMDAYDAAYISNNGGIRLGMNNYAGTTNSYHIIKIEGGKSSSGKMFQHFFGSGYLSQNGVTNGITTSSAAFSALTITSNGTLNGGSYAIWGA